MRIYIVYVHCECHDDDFIEGVYSNKEKAEKVAEEKRTPYNKVTVEEYIMDVSAE